MNTRRAQRFSGLPRPADFIRAAAIVLALVLAAGSAAMAGDAPSIEMEGAFTPGANFQRRSRGRVDDRVFMARVRAPLLSWGSDEPAHVLDWVQETSRPAKRRTAPASSLGGELTYRTHTLRVSRRRPPAAQRSRRADEEGVFLTSVAFGLAMSQRLTEDIRVLARLGGGVATDTNAISRDDLVSTGNAALTWSASRNLRFSLGVGAGYEFGPLQPYPLAGIRWNLLDNVELDVLAPLSARLVRRWSDEVSAGFFARRTGERFHMETERVLTGFGDQELFIAALESGLGADIRLWDRLDLRVEAGVATLRRLEWRGAGRRRAGGRVNAAALVRLRLGISF